MNCEERNGDEVHKKIPGEWRSHRSKINCNLRCILCKKKSARHSQTGLSIDSLEVGLSPNDLSRNEF